MATADPDSRHAFSSGHGLVVPLKWYRGLVLLASVWSESTRAGYRVFFPGGVGTTRIRWGTVSLSTFSPRLKQMADALDESPKGW
jgi:hypothetical protein